MNLRYAGILLGLGLSTMASASQDGVMFEVRLLNGEEVVASPNVVAEFGKEVTIELPKTMRVVAVASAPNGDGHSMTAVKLSVFAHGELQPARESSMLADLSKAPSFEYAAPGTNYRFVVMSRKVKIGT